MVDLATRYQAPWAFEGGRGMMLHPDVLIAIEPDLKHIGACDISTLARDEA